MGVQLFDQFGREIKRPKVPDQRPLAVAPLMDGFREYVTDGLTPERLASVFKEADQGNVRRQAELFDQLEEKDGHLLCERDKRKNIILDLQFAVEPASDSARDGQVAEFVNNFFGNYADWDDCKTAMQDAVGKGYAGLEIFWDVSMGQAVPSKLDFLEQTRFQFTDPAGRYRRTPRLLSDEFPMGEEIPAWKVLFHQYGGKSGNPNRAGIYRVAAWMVLFKHYTLKDWVVFCEIFGMPLRLGKYDQGATKDDKAALYAAISSLGTDAAGIISKSTEIEFIETAGKASGDLYKALAEFCNGENSKAILGQTLSAEVGDRGSYAAGKVHDGIRKDLLLADGRAQAATTRNQLIRPLVGFNFGWDTPLPKYTAVLEEDEDLGKKAEWFEKVTNKMQVPVSWARQQFRIPEPARGEEMVGGPQFAQPFPAKLVVAKDRPIAVNPGAAVIEQLTGKAVGEGDLADDLAPVRELLEQSTTLDEFRDRLLEAGESMDMASLGAMMQRAFALAELSGRFDASQEGQETA
ncbi:MAG: DUF935 domain-containing protein [Desulfobulbaceae bacterium]|jgi:phage gp29-like protein